MAAVDLLFRQPPVSQPADLLFGEVENLPDIEVTLSAALPGLTAAISIKPVVQVTLSAALPAPTFGAFVAPAPDVTLAATLPPPTFNALVAPPVDVTLVADLPALTVDVHVGPVALVTVDAVLPGLTVVAVAKYTSDTARPLVGHTDSRYQVAAGADASVTAKHQASDRMRTGAEAHHQQADKLPAGAAARHSDSARLHDSAAARHQEARQVSDLSASGYANMLRSMRPLLDSAWREAEGRRSSARTDWQERYRDRRPSLASSWGTAARLLKQVSSFAGKAKPFENGWDVRYQEAIVPPPGMYVRPVQPPGEPCYTPPAANAVFLVFDAPWAADTNLVFICERHVTPPTETVIVPVRRVYMVINNATLMRVDGFTLTALPTYSMSLTIDVDSWTWGFSASLPDSTLASLQPVDGMPVELQASINGLPYRVLAEKLQRDRSFGKSSIRVTGRGKSALLSDPYAPIMNFSNSVDRTAQQLMNDALTFNGVPIGWDVDWNIEDWLVPAGAWSKQGRYIDALAAIAGAAGAYLQPHPTDQVMHVLPRYPLAPWEWATDMTPDFELPSAVTSTEGIQWLDKTRYNRVFVSGVSAGVIGQVTRAGTAGDVLAAMVTDPLITDEIAARQRGKAILSDTGRQAIVSLRLPVLEETGIITPGKTVRYVDGSDIKLGIVRSTGVEVNGQPDVWQSLAVETHVEA